MKVVDLVGNTPLVYVDNINGNRIYAKLEYYNPSGSVKDRAALYMMKGAIARGELKEGGTIIEPTSGNTGIGLAMLGRQLGFKVVLTMPSSMSIERVKLLKALGAEVNLTDKALGMKGAIDKAYELRGKICNSYIPMQFENEDGVLAHFETTAPEIFKAINADYVVAGVGSGGTVMGVKKYILANGIDAKIVAIEPFESPVMSGGNPAPHGIQGIGANFLPKIVDLSIIDKIIQIASLDGYQGAKILADRYGVMSGISGGAAYMACVKLSEEVVDKDIVFVVPDGALKYLSNEIYG